MQLLPSPACLDGALVAGARPTPPHLHQAMAIMPTGGHLSMPHPGSLHLQQGTDMPLDPSTGMLAAPADPALPATPPNQSSRSLPCSPVPLAFRRLWMLLCSVGSLLLWLLHSIRLCLLTSQSSGRPHMHAHLYGLPAVAQVQVRRMRSCSSEAPQFCHALTVCGSFHFLGQASHLDAGP